MLGVLKDSYNSLSTAVKRGYKTVEVIGGSDCAQCVRWDALGPGARNAAHVRGAVATTSPAAVPVRRAGPGMTAAKVAYFAMRATRFSVYRISFFSPSYVNLVKGGSGMH